MLCRTGHYACLELQFLCSQVYLPDIQVIPAYASIVRNFLSLEILHREGLRPRTAVDLACGTGTMSALFTRRGYEMIGVDASSEMLMQAQKQNLMMFYPVQLLKVQIKN